MKNIKKVYILFIIIVFSLINVIPSFAAGKRIIAENKYIWVYINGERKILPDNMGYPCFGQGIDNKNILYIPLKVLTDITGNTISTLKKTANADGTYTYSVDVTGTKTFTVNIGQATVGEVKLSGAPFILKGTEIKSNVIMVPLGFAKDGLGLSVEVEKPVGRGVYDYCSLAINFTGESIAENSSSEIIDTPNSNNTTNPSDTETENTSKEDALENASSDKFYVSADDSVYYHAYSCPKIKDKTTSKLSEYEAVFWGYIPDPDCIGEKN